MSINVLQAKLAEQKHLLSPQIDCLERLLFQLAFNSCSNVNITGARGSGKSTLALAAAELFSEQNNVALISASVEKSDIAPQLIQQWFAKPFNPVLSLKDQVCAEISHLPLMLIADDADQLPDDVLQALKQLPCLLISFSEQPISEAELILTLNKITLADAEKLLHSQGLNYIEVADRYAAASGNLNLLLAPTVKSVAPQPEIAPVRLPVNSLFYLVIAVGLALLAYLFWPEAKHADNSPSLTTDEVSAQFESSKVEDSTARQQTDDVSVSKDVEQAELADAETEVSLDSRVIDSESERVEPPISNNIEATVEDDKSEIDSTVTESTTVNEEDKKTAGVTEQADPELAQFMLDESKLLNMQKQSLAVQLAVLSSAEALARFKANHPTVAINSYLRNWQGKVQWVVILAPYDDNNEARAAIAALPESLKNSGPFVKTLQAVQAEIRARQHSNLAESDRN